MSARVGNSLGSVRQRPSGDGAMPEGLARLLRERRPAPAGERCDMCNEGLGAAHRHVVDTSDRRILCCCQACGLLFTDARAARGRYRTVPDRWLSDPALTRRLVRWDRLQIPVRVAFFFVNSSLGRVVGFYPGPGGATESELALDAWEGVLAATPLARALLPDVEALLVDRGGDERRPTASQEPPSCYLVPIDVCYELVGRLRLRWVGFDGGAEAHDELDQFLAMVRERSRPVTALAE